MTNTISNRLRMIPATDVQSGIRHTLTTTNARLTASGNPETSATELLQPVFANLHLQPEISEGIQLKLMFTEADSERFTQLAASWNMTPEAALTEVLREFREPQAA